MRFLSPAFRFTTVLLLPLLLTSCLSMLEEDEPELLPPEHDVSGTWTGTWGSSDHPEFGGSVTLTLQTSGNQVTGTASFEGSDCFSGTLPVEGTLSGTIASLDAGNGSIHMEGATYDGMSLSGNYTVGRPEGCEDTGQLSLTKTSTLPSEKTTLEGEWTGSWNSITYPDFDGDLTLALQQFDDELTGTALFTGSDCFSGPVSLDGSVTGASIFLNAGDNIFFTGSLSGSALNGAYTVTLSEDCEDTGTITLTKRPGG